eukprot:TRINITY_DN4040_c0_g1_i3.p1 TRINITY_DN4040_c0_g1~~TRINITY_DN4040_c0_g1_i3.p1  ORF type:complete len:503 (-),score=198.21 TRINITY_DN4040_c0_g1_i3:1804-3312(-)
MGWPEIDAAKEHVLSTLKGKRDLKLSGEKIAKRIADEGQIDPNLWKLADLTKLELSALPTLTTLAPQVCLLENLMEFILSGTKITQLPPQLFQLHIRNFIAENNQITELPKEIGTMKTLQVVNFSGNKLTRLPDEFAQLTELISVNFAHNAFEAFPNQLAKLPRLSTLILCHNPLKTMNSDLDEVATLTSVDLSSNQLTELPGELADLPKLKELKLEDNPFKDKKFIKIIKENKLKNITLHLKRSAPKPKKQEKQEDEEPPAPKRLKLQPPAGGVQRMVLHKTQTVRPFIAACIVRGLKLNETSFKRFIDLQTEIHQKLCNKRTLAAFGTHDAKLIEAPYSYEAVAPADIKFVPLREETEMTALDFATRLQQAGDETALKYLGAIKANKLWPVLYDNRREVLSLPPVINGRYSQCSVDTTDVLIECSSTKDMQICKDVLGAFVKAISKFSTDGIGEGKWQTDDDEAKEHVPLIVEPVEVVTEDGHLKVKYPNHREVDELNED